VRKYPLDTVETITGVEANDIVEAARFYARSKPASIQMGGPYRHDSGDHAAVAGHRRAVGLTGNLDVPGGNVFSRFAFDAVAYALPGAEGVIKLKSKEQDRTRIGADRYGPLKRFIWRAQTDLVSTKSSQASPTPSRECGFRLQPSGGIGMDPARWQEALEKLDFIAAWTSS